MTESKILIDTLDMLDEFEKNRKADYSIWGYLYQFDLMFYDMLTDKDKSDLFNDYNKLSGKLDIITYEAEMIEDYCKEFTINDQKHVRLAQIKYNARSKTNFYKENKDALKTLYYIYLKAKILDCESFDLKCSLFYFNQNEKNNNSNDYSDKIREELETIINSEVKKLDDELNNKDSKIEPNEWVSTTIDNEILYNQLTSKDLSGRIQYLFYNLSNKEYLNDFIDNTLITKKVPERQDLIAMIKQKLEEEYSYLRSNDYSLSEEINKGDLLYSLGINFIINEWQSKKEKNERKPINLQQVLEYIHSMNSRDVLIDDIVEKILVEYFDELIYIIESDIYKDIYDDKFEEQQGNEIIDNFEILLHELLEFLRRILKERTARYSLFNTISNNRFKTREEYLQMSVIEEYAIINQMKDLFMDFCRRILKIMYWEKYIQNKSIDLDEWFRIDEELWIFKKKDLKIKTVLLPNVSDDRVKDICRDIVYRMRKVDNKYSKPRLWYFKSINENKGYSDRILYDLREIQGRGGMMHYTLNITKIADDNIRNNIVGNNDDYFYIECMDCLKMNSMSNYESIEHIFSERCVKCGIRKSR
ncbi:Uncharacterised protein [[Clostridium] sordellii]|uniref:Uncharacterized protein n=1 Tax=Paraclostridium sordellii TaxID=1505 RepID=A0A0C7R265_PARSO|nr:hypothetical protein [Paeniclostridium sordellii]CEQ02930.1 Uncharacterised protein [[Clostridium] sordellii] [Paeniclostridium sordellii]